MEDLCLMSIKELVKKIEAENLRQIAKWGVQDRTEFEWLAYLTEELGELSEAITEEKYRHGEIENIVKEAVHVATLALKIAEMFDHKYELFKNKKNLTVK